MPVVDPATEEVVAEVPAATTNDVADAVSAASIAFRTWSRLPVGERARALHRVADGLRSHRRELAELLTREQGKLVQNNEDELDLAADTFDFFAELPRHDAGHLVAPGDSDQLDFVLRVPYGVTACIIPWNFPIQLMAWKVAPALASGNTVIIKPSALTPLATLLFARVATSHLPGGVLNVVTGRGAEIGEALTLHPEVRHIALTGSLETGRRVASLAAPMMKKVSLELGGKDPLIVAPDVDVDMAVHALAFAGLLNAGQCCTSTERVFVAQDRFDEFADALVAHVRRFRVGSGLDPSSDMGPMVSAQARAKVEEQVVSAVAAGARILTGGRRPQGLTKGFFYEPTVLIEAPEDSALIRKETFGPVLPLLPYRDVDEAIRKANDTEYGLAASLLTHDPKFVKRFVDGVEAGTLYVNDPLTPNPAAAFGGMKQSGLGRELGLEGLQEFTQVKHVHWDMVGSMKSAWRLRSES